MSARRPGAQDDARERRKPEPAVPPLEQRTGREARIVAEPAAMSALTYAHATGEAREVDRSKATRPLRVLVVDDEPLAQERLVHLLAGESDVLLTGIWDTGLAALEAITADPPDVVFLDVQMPELDGIGVAEALPPGSCPEIVFVTAHSEYMERAFEMHAVDYLRKPYSNARFQTALSHARDRVRARRLLVGEQQTTLEAEPTAGNSLFDRYARVLATLRPGRLDTRIALQDRRTQTWHILSRDEIDWVQAAEASGRVLVHFGSETSVWQRTLNSAEQELAPYGFLRVHRSYLVNATRVRRIKALQKGEYAVVLANGTVLDTGRHYRAVIEAFLHGN